MSVGIRSSPCYGSSALSVADWGEIESGKWGGFFVEFMV